MSSSRNPWVERLPSGWSEAMLRWCSQLLTGGTPDKKKTEYWQSGDIPWLASGEVNKGRIREADAFITRSGLDNSSAKWLPPGSVVMALAGQGKTKGMVALLEFKATCNQSLAAIVPKTEVLSPLYLYFYLDSQYRNIRGLVGDGLRDGLSLGHIGSIHVPLPPLSIQQTIADYLDRKTEAIDAIIAKKQRLIDLLEEKRAALINRAVTKGLNPDVPMKDSGVEWIGEIPEHWNTRKLRYIAAKLQGRLIVQPHLYFEDEGIPIVFGYNIKGGKIDEKCLSRVSFDADAKHPHARARAGDLFTVRLGNPGMTAVVPPNLDGCHFASIMWVHQHKRADSNWLCHAMNSHVVQAQLGAANYGATLSQFNIAEAVDWILPFPPKAEQTQIAAFLDVKLVRIGTLSRQLAASISSLREYRQALITATVTGQNDAFQVSSPGSNKTSKLEVVGE